MTLFGRCFCCLATAKMVISTLLIIWAFTALQPFWRFLHSIKGHWLTFFSNYLTLKRYRRRHPRGRQDLHELFDSEELAKIGMAALPEEVAYANPKLNQSEDLFINAGNTGERTTLQIYLTRRPLPASSNSFSSSLDEAKFEPSRDAVSVSFRLHDGQGNVYVLEEKTVVEFSPTEYRGAGFAFEALEGNRIGRIKFRGYLRRNEESELVFVKIRFLVLSFSKTFDHQRLFDARWLAKELHSTAIGEVEDLLEDRIEQFAHIKGTFKVEEEEETELHFIGNVGRRFPPRSAVLPRRVVRISGFSKDGLGFQVGLVRSGRFAFRYGFASRTGENFKLMSGASLTKEQLEELVDEGGVDSKRQLTFDVIFGGKKAQITKIELGKSIGAGRRLIRVDGVEGIAFLSGQTFTETEYSLPKTTEALEEDSSEEFKRKLVVSLSEGCARLTSLTGGKGASLAQLKKLSETKNQNSIGGEWAVPKAVVVTTSAYALQTNSSPLRKEFTQKLKKLEEQALKKRENVEASCNHFSAWFAEQSLNEKVKAELQRKLDLEFGVGSWENQLFAVRSSVAGLEDSAEMSAAGQMTTFLGVKGLEKICRAVVSCWSSQFAFVPVEYKRGYGQLINSPMAVVIQEVIDCQAAGVLFTAAPTDGDERKMTVTSNFGLGESVVSAAAEPDTFTLGVKIKANAYDVPRVVSGILERQLGKKALVTRLKSENHESSEIDGTENEAASGNADKASILDESLIHLGNVALEIAAHYGNARDLEWGIHNGRLYLLQSRPITALDSSFTSYELMHELDSAHMSECELYSRAHWGENFPGSGSWLALFTFLNSAAFMRMRVQTGEKELADFNPFHQDWGYMYNQLMFNMKGGPFAAFFSGYPKNARASAMIMSFFGRHLTDPEVLATFQPRPGEAPAKMSLRAKLGFAKTFWTMLFCIRPKIQALKRKLFEENFGDMVSGLRTVPLAQKLDYLYRNFNVNSREIMVHRLASMGSMFKSMFLMKALKSAAPDPQTAEADLNLLMSTCNDVVSAEVPNMLKDIAKAIKDKAGFAALPDEEALEVLQGAKGSESEAAVIFADFLKWHGHRGLREMDVYNLPWERNPLPCVQVVKSLLLNNSSLERKAEVSIESVMSQLATPLNGAKRALITNLLLPWARDAVGFRENTKSLMVKFQNCLRRAMWAIAEEAASEGLLPEAELFFFLKVDEIGRLLRGERNPSLVMKAKLRRRLHPTMNAFKFDEFVKGLRMAPRPPKAEVIRTADDAVTLTGTAVTVGSIKARVCVAETLAEAVNIKPGDILLTYSTDIGWSPYFPLLSGIVTEIGGTVSHGAVIAREFGIPCLIAVEDVCGYFRTGEWAYLDTKTGTIVKVKEDGEE